MASGHDPGAVGHHAFGAFDNSFGDGFLSSDEEDGAPAGGFGGGNDAMGDEDAAARRATSALETAYVIVSMQQAVGRAVASVKGVNERASRLAEDMEVKAVDAMANNPFFTTPNRPRMPTDASEVVERSLTAASVQVAKADAAMSFKGVEDA